MDTRSQCHGRRAEIRRSRGVRLLSCEGGFALEGFSPRSRDAARDAGHGAREFQRRVVHAFRRDDPVLDARRQVLRAHRRARWEAHRLRDRVHVRRLPAAAVSHRVPRRPLSSAERGVGRAASARGRAAMVPSLSEGSDGARRHPPLDRPVPELELHVRGVPLHERREGLRSRHRRISHHLLRGERLMRSVSRPRLSARRVGAASAPARRPRPSRDDGLIVQLRDSVPATWIRDTITGLARRSTPADVERRTRDVRALSFAPVRARRSLHARPPAHRHAPAIAPRREFVFRRRADPG